MQFEQLNKSHLTALFDFEQRNRAWFEQYVPARPVAYQAFDGFQLVMCELLIEQEKGDGCFYAVTEGDVIIARANLIDIKNNQAEVGYRVCQSAVRMGVATFALSQLIHVAFSVLNLDRLTAMTTDNNLASVHVLEKTGVRVDGGGQGGACVLNKQILNFVHYELKNE